MENHVIALRLLLEHSMHCFCPHLIGQISQMVIPKFGRPGKPHPPAERDRKEKWNTGATEMQSMVHYLASKYSVPLLYEEQSSFPKEMT